IMRFAIVVTAHCLRNRTVVEGPSLPDVATNAVSSSLNASKQKLTTAAPRSKSAQMIALPQSSAVAHHDRDDSSDAPVTVKPKEQKAREARALPSSVDRRPI